MRATTGKRALAALLAIGVRQQAAYQRKTLLDKQTQRSSSTPEVSVTQPGGI